MPRFGLTGVIAVLSTAIATPLLAQAAISEPGAYAFYHPDASLGLETTQPTTEATGWVPVHHRGPYIVGIHRSPGEKHRG